MTSERKATEVIPILHAFSSLTRTMAEQEELELLLQSALDQLVRILDIPYVSLILSEKNQSAFRIGASHGYFPFTPGLESLLDVSKLRLWPFKAGEKLVFRKLIDNSKWSKLRACEQRGLTNTLCFPLVADKKNIGLAFAYDEGSKLNPLDTEVFCLWTNLVSVAIEKSHLSDRIRKPLRITRGERKQAQSQLIRSEKLRSLSEIAMSVAHTIRNPVTVIGGLARRIYKELPKEDPKREQLQVIVSEASRLEAIVSEFRRFFSINQISFESADVNQLAEEVADEFLAQYQPEPDFELKRKLWNEPLVCQVDPNLLDRCLLHLLENARDASDNHISITLATFKKRNQAIIDVSDSGRGMSREEMDRVFDPFYTTKGEGPGMGLTFAHFVVTEHSGRIEVLSKKGVGTRFRIRLPLESSG